MPVAPWEADSLDHVTTADTIEPVYSVHFKAWDAISAADAVAWDVDVTLDGGASPYGRASFKTAVGDYLSNDTVRFPPPFVPSQILSPYMAKEVIIKAGYRRGGTANLYTLFWGYITKREAQWDAETGEAYIQWEAETGETLHDYPSNRSYSVGSTLTSVKGVVDLVNAAGTPWWRQVYLSNEAGYLTAPTAGQLTAFRGLTLQVGDSIADFLRTMGAALGQWVRGDVRNVGAGSPNEFLVSTDPYPYRAATALTRSMFAKLTRTEDVNEWGNILELTTTWTDPSSNDTKSKRRVYTDVYLGYPYQIRGKAVTVNAYPPSGSLPASYALADVWKRRVGPMAEGRYTGTTRAMFWLQPRIDGVNLTDNGCGDSAGPLDRVTFHVDKGTQDLTWSVDTPFTW